MNLTGCAAELYARIQREGNWLADPKCLNYEQQQTLLALRKAGKIEQAAYGGYRIKAGSVKPASADTVRALLAKHGIQVGEIKPCKDARARGANSWAFVLPAGVKLGAAWGEFASVYVDQRVCVVELKG